MLRIGAASTGTRLAAAAAACTAIAEAAARIRGAAHALATAVGVEHGEFRSVEAAVAILVQAREFVRQLGQLLRLLLAHLPISVVFGVFEGLCGLTYVTTSVGAARICIIGRRGNRRRAG